MEPSKKGTTLVHCTVCNCDFSVAGGGVHEVKQHCGSVKHTQGLKAVSKQPTLAAAFLAARPAPRDQVTTAELYFASFIVNTIYPLQLLTISASFASACSQTARLQNSTRLHEQRRLLSSRMPWFPQLIRR